ncbi:unnamed protein product, partial [Ectocarpus sp. 12 AP-2014]
STISVIGGTPPRPVPNFAPLMKGLKPSNRVVDGRSSPSLIFPSLLSTPMLSLNTSHNDPAMDRRSCKGSSLNLLSICSQSLKEDGWRRTPLVDSNPPKPSLVAAAA